ncbi:MAG TPA: WbqC family protein [Candidatus Cloacimonadota bacterium]|nr:WbqC family protein [Candidatus Cloacimonadota bacterium]
MNKIAILQSNYIPWKGYFHIIKKVDHFVFLDTAQYTQRDWRNRNQIKTPNGLLWLTVPTNGSQNVKINDVKIDNSQNWSADHFHTLERCYACTPHFEDFRAFLQKIYVENTWEYLSDLNRYLIVEISHLLEFDTEFHLSTEFILPCDKNEKIISVIHQLAGTHYISGPSAKSYIDEDIFAINDIRLEWMDYTQYPVYEQPWQPFVHEVSILDLLFCLGKEKAIRYFRSLPGESNDQI